MDYYQYSAEDLAADDFFKEWVCTPSAHTEAFWRTFLANSPERYYQVEEARRLVEGLGQLHDETVLHTQVNRVWSRIEGTLTSAHRGPSRRRLFTPHLWQLAASVALLLVLGWVVSYTLNQADTPLTTSLPESQPEWVEAVNEAHQTLHLQLADGSQIQLGKNSRLRYPKTFSGAIREVYLTGEAFFDIHKNPHKPFLVYTNGLVTKVLGTSFHVQALADSPHVTVSVKSGRVSVYAEKSSRDPEAEGVVLTPNQKAVFQRKEAIISKALVDQPLLLIPESKKSLFAFEAASAQEVFTALEKAYGVDVVFDEEILRSCTLTVDLTQESLYQKLEVICKVLGAQYKLIDGQIIIYSKGC